MKLLFDESPSPKLPQLLSDLARAGDRTILEYASAHDFILVSTDSDFQGLLKHVPGSKVVILRSCDYPTDVAA